MKTTGILLVNLGTPDAPTKSAVKKYLIEFLTDGRVIDIPWLQRQFLVRGVIIPKRLASSLKSYQKIWTEEGSPLLVHSLKTRELLQASLGENYQVEIAMRYQSPSVADALKKLRGVKELIVLPLFPQYASATTGSIFEKTFQELSSQLTFPKMTFIDQFHDHPQLIQAFKEVSTPFHFPDYDHILFSFHGLPERQLKKSGPDYVDQCYGTADAIAKKCNLKHYSVCFQSRLGKEPWTRPYASDRIKELAHNGAKKVLVFCPAFVADCLETLFEISVEYKELFIHEGGEALNLVPGLNSHPAWIEALKQIILSQGTKPLHIAPDTSLEQVQDPFFPHALAQSK